jgi:biopolymer transport protein TolR
MPRRSRNQGSGLPTSVEVNVTSLVDVAFTLLVIFIITAPIMQGGVEVKIPRAEAAPITSPEGLIVTIDREGQIYLGDVASSWDEFESAFPDVVRAKQVQNVYLRADEGVPYGRVLQVLGKMKALDVATVGLIAEPEPIERRRPTSGVAAVPNGRGGG